MSFKFGLNVKSKTAGAANKPNPGKRKPLLDDDADDDTGKAEAVNAAQDISGFELDDAVIAADSSKPRVSMKSKKGQPPPPPKRKPLVRQDDPTVFGNSASTLEAEKHAKQAVEIDASIYDYDAAYDALHAKNSAKAAAEKEDALQRRPKYMDSVFKASEVRKKDELRARDKLLQREREAEGDEFDDKEKFVTGAYKAQQEEARQLEAEEEKRQAAEEEKRKKSGMQGFHKRMLMEEEKRHQEAMEAAERALKEGVKPQAETEKEKTDAEIAEELRKQGKNIVLNEEGQITDKRQLLTAGLNVIAKPKPANSSSTASSRQTEPQSGYQGRNVSQRLQRERQTEMIAQQIEQAAKRKADEEAEEQRKLQHASKSQKTAGEISSAKERYLQRKREAAAAKAATASGK